MQLLRDYFLRNNLPIYFIDWCIFSGFGMEQWLGGVHFICATDTFDGLHPQLYKPHSFDYDHTHSSEKTLNAMLSNQQVREFFGSRGGGKAMFWLLDEETERLSAENRLEICLPPVEVRNRWDNKANTNRLAEKAGVPCVPYVLSPVEDYAHLRRISRHLGDRLVVQMPHGMSGSTTFFISSEEDFEKHRSDITSGEEMKIMRRIECRSSGLEACITRHGVVVTTLLGELVGIPEITIHKGGWCGNELYPGAFSEDINRKAREYTIRMGEQLRKVGYRGYFEPDFLIDQNDGTLYLGEMNLRFSGFTPLVNNSSFCQKDIPLLLLHLAEWMDVDYKLDVNALNDSWSQQENIEPLSFLHFKNVEEAPAHPLPTGIYRMDAGGNISFVRPATNLSTLTADNEAFWLGTAGKGVEAGIGEEFGGLFIRERVTTDGQQLTPKARAWVEGMKSLAFALVHH